MTDLCKDISEFGKGISNKNRYNLLQVLLKGPKTVNDLARKTKLAQSAVSQHLKNLKSKGLVIDERRGQRVLYSANSQYMLGLLKNLSDQVEKRKERDD